MRAHLKMEIESNQTLCGFEFDPDALSQLIFKPPIVLFKQRITPPIIGPTLTPILLSVLYLEVYNGTDYVPVGNLCLC